MAESVMRQGMKQWMSSFDIRWGFWQKVEAMLKAGNYQCDLLSEPLDLIHVGRAHCSKGPIDGKVVVEIPSEPKETCRIILLNSTEEMRDRIHKEGRHYDIAEYDRGRYSRGEPTDIELHVPCNQDDIESELAILYKAGFAYGGQIGKPEKIEYGTEALKDKWYSIGEEAGKTDDWMDIENTIKETAERHPEIKDAPDLVYEDIEQWKQTDHYRIKYGSRMWEDAPDEDIHSELEVMFWQGYVEGRKQIGKDIFAIASELVKPEEGYVPPVIKFPETFADWQTLGEKIKSETYLKYGERDESFEKEIDDKISAILYKMPGFEDAKRWLVAKAGELDIKEY